MYQVLSLVLSRLVFRSSTCFSVVLLRFSVIPFYYYYTFKLVVKDACAFASNMLMVQIDRSFFLFIWRNVAYFFRFRLPL